MTVTLRNCFRAAVSAGRCGPKGPGVTLFEVLKFTEYVTPTLEIIDARIEQLDRDTRVPRKVFDTIADFAANAGIILGGRPVKPDGVDLRWVDAKLFKNAVSALQNLDAIAAVHGVDGVFFGPADLSASMGLLGKPLDPAVRIAVLDGISRVKKAGKAAGMLSGDRTMAQEFLAAGALVVGVGADTTLLVKAAKALAESFKSERVPESFGTPSGSVY